RARLRLLRLVGRRHPRLLLRQLVGKRRANDSRGVFLGPDHVFGGYSPAHSSSGTSPPNWSSSLTAGATVVRSSTSEAGARSPSPWYSSNRWRSKLARFSSPSRPSALAASR